VTVSTDRATFGELRLDDPDLDALTCLHNLRAEGPDNPYALRNVTPLLDIDLESRYRVITSPEELARLDHRTDLMQMDPYEFERLIAALFRAKGYEAWHTQSSRDDGIDAIATKRDAHVPVECLIQVKRTRNVVPPKEIQALMGALAEHPTATNGLLVTTSWFSDRSRRRGWDRRIGTMEGGELREQIQTYLDRDVVISARPPARRR
jgi:restriction system protein